MALALLAPRLRRVVARWRRAGARPVDLDDLEADLLAETLALLLGPRRWPPAALVDGAWAAVRTGRRRQLARLARQLPLAAGGLTGRRRQLARLARQLPLAAGGLTATVENPPVLLAASIVIDAVRTGALTVQAAQAVWVTGVAGWPAEQATRQLGCRPDTLRARRSRAIRALAA